MEYRLFYFDGFTLVGSDLVEADGETDALLKAVRLAGGRSFELWHGHAKRHTFPAADRIVGAAPPQPRAEPASGAVVPPNGESAARGDASCDC